MDAAAFADRLLFAPARAFRTRVRAGVRALGHRLIEAADRADERELDFDLFPSAPTVDVPAPRPSTRKAGPLSLNRDDAAIADRDNSRARRPRA